MQLLCRWCKESKPADQFIMRRRIDPVCQSNVRCCKECQSKYNRRRYGDPGIRAKQLRANMAWRKAHPERLRSYEKKSHAAMPARQRARNRVGYMLRQGLWMKQPCVICGRLEDVEAHHDSYAEAHWETVRWLCKEHHEIWHMVRDPMRKEILGETEPRINALRQEASEVQRQLIELRERFRTLHSEADALDLASWNRLLEALQPKWAEFCR